MSGDHPTDIDAVLETQRSRGLIGPGSLDAVKSHSQAFAEAAGPAPRRALDLGSGGGIPGLVLATQCWPAAHLTLLDASQRRCTFLELAVIDLGLRARVDVVWGRAEDLGHSDALRGVIDVVVARSFGAPALTAECAAPFLQAGGVLVVSDPPVGGPERWDPAGLALLGLEPESAVIAREPGFSRLRQISPCPSEYPRRTGVLRKSPLF